MRAEPEALEAALALEGALAVGALEAALAQEAARALGALEAARAQAARAQAEEVEGAAEARAVAEVEAQVAEAQAAAEVLEAVAAARAGGGWSDRRLKRNVRRVGSTSEGFGLYSFQYIWGGPDLIGVMAQEIVNKRPDAVVVGEGGYLYVDYERLGLRMVTREEFERDRAAVLPGDRTESYFSPSSCEKL